MIVAPVSPEAPCVDAARDSLYCPQDTQFMPQAAPRGGQPPTPKPRSGNLGYPKYIGHICRYILPRTTKKFYLS